MEPGPSPGDRLELLWDNRTSALQTCADVRLELGSFSYSTRFGPLGARMKLERCKVSRQEQFPRELHP